MRVRHTFLALLAVFALAFPPRAASAQDTQTDPEAPASGEDVAAQSDDDLPADASDNDDQSAESDAAPKPLIADRAGGADSPYTVGSLVFVIEAGLDWARDGDNGISDAIRTPLGLRFGIHEFAELHVISDGFAWDRRLVQGVSLGSTTGGSDVRFGGKVEFPGFTDEGPGTGLVLSLITPTGTDAFTSDLWAIFATLAFDQPLPAGLSLGINLGATVPVTDRDDNPDVARYVLALGWSAAPIDERLGIFVELFGDSTLSSDSETALYFNGGLTWAISEVLAVDLAARAGLTDIAPDVGIASGFAIRL